MRCLFLLVFLFACTTLFSQILGQVKDSESGSNLVGAVICHQSDTIISDENGRFRLLNIRDDESDLTIMHLGYNNRIYTISSTNHFLLISLEPKPEEIEEITISTSILEQKLKTSVSSLGLAKASVLRLENPVNIGVSLNAIPGVFMAEGNKNTNRIIIRGMGSRTPYASNRIKAYLNDIPLSAGDGTTVIEDIDVSGISRMEVLKGPSSSIYGSGLGGTIRLYTDSPLQKNFTLSGRSEIASFNSFRNVVKLGFRADNGFINSGFNQWSGNGFRENSKYLRNNAFINGSLNFEKLELNFYSSFIEVDAEIPSSLDYETFHINPASAAKNWISVNGKERYSRFIGGLGVDYMFSEKLNISTTLFTNYRDAYEKRPFNNLSENSANYGIRSQLGFNYKGIHGIVGSELFTESYVWKIFETINGISGDLNNRNKEERQYMNVFALFKAKLSKKLFLESGMNINFLNYRLFDQFLNDGNDISGSFKYHHIISPRIGFIYTKKAQHLYGNIGHGFSHPSLEETLMPAGERNTDLQPEKAWNYEIGFRGPLLSNRIYFDLAVYRIDLKNILLTKRLSEEIFFGVNAGKTRHYGVELYTQYLLYQHSEKTKILMNLACSMTRNYFLDFIDDGIDYTGNSLPGIPSWNLNTTLRAEHKSGLSMYLKYSNVGRQYLNDMNDSKYGNYAVTDIKLQYGIKIFNKSGLKIYAGIDNLFNKRYASMILVNAPSFNGSLPRYYYPGQFRTLLFGVSVDLHGGK